MRVSNLPKAVLDIAVDGIEPAISSRKSNAITTMPTTQPLPPPSTTIPFFPHSYMDIIRTFHCIIAKHNSSIKTEPYTEKAIYLITALLVESRVVSNPTALLSVQPECIHADTLF